MRFVNSFRFRLAALFGALALVIGLAVTLSVEELAARSMTASSGEQLLGVTRSIAGTLTANLGERTREIELVAASPIIAEGDWDRPSLRVWMDAVKSSYRPYAWMGLADVSGRVVVAADGLLQGGDVSQRPWFVTGLERTFIGDVHEALLLAEKLGSDGAEPLRFIDFAAPVTGPGGEVRGVVATHLHWSWIESVVREALPRAASDAGVEVFVVGANDEVLYPFGSAGRAALPLELPARGFDVTEAVDEMAWLVASAPVDAPLAEDLAWRIVLRQPVEMALAEVTDLRRNLLLIGVPVIGLFVLLGWWFAVAFSRPVEELARVARRIDEGDEAASFPERSGIHELRHLAISLRGMTATLIRRRRELEQTNQSLEQMVASRTAQLQEANCRLEVLSSTDALTQLANRRGFDAALAEEWARARRNGDALGVILIDLDLFKAYNDGYGHVAGDACLRQVGALLAGKVRRAGELAARYGGEEFVVLVSQTDKVALAQLAESIRQTFEDAAIEHEDSPFGHVTASLGIAVCVPDGEAAPAALVERADAALYRAKEAGRNRVEA